MTHREHNTLREDREERKTKEEEMKDPGPLNFLLELVTEENLSPEVTTSYRKLMWTMANQFHQEMRSCITFAGHLRHSHRGNEGGGGGIHRRSM
jgi:hypothetical protein